MYSYPMTIIENCLTLKQTVHQLPLFKKKANFQSWMKSFLEEGPGGQVPISLSMPGYFLW